MNRAIPRRAAEPPLPRGRIGASNRHEHRPADAMIGPHDVPLPPGHAPSGQASSDEASYRRFDHRHETGRPETPKRESFETDGRVRDARHGNEGDDVTGAFAEESPGHPAGDEQRVEDDLAVTLRSLLRLHAADLIVTLQRWGERLDTREAILELRTAHLDLLQRRGRATPRRRTRAADSEPPETSVRAGKPREWQHELGWQHELEAQRHAIDRLLQDAERFADRLESQPSV